MLLSPPDLTTATPCVLALVSRTFRLQLIQNAAVRLLTRTKRTEHITPLLAVPHWLPLNFRIDFKILLLVSKALSGKAQATSLTAA